MTEPFVSNNEDMDAFLPEKNTPQFNALLKSMGLKLAIEADVPLYSETA